MGSVTRGMKWCAKVKPLGSYVVFRLNSAEQGEQSKA